MLELARCFYSTFPKRFNQKEEQPPRPQNDNPWQGLLKIGKWGNTLISSFKVFVKNRQWKPYKTRKEQQSPRPLNPWQGWLTQARADIQQTPCQNKPRRAGSAHQQRIARPSGHTARTCFGRFLTTFENIITGHGREQRLRRGAWKSPPKCGDATEKTPPRREFSFAAGVVPSLPPLFYFLTKMKKVL